MERVWEILEKRGCNIPQIKERFMDDTQFYLECYEQFMLDDNFRILGVQLRAKQVTEAFETAHTLKGLAANMGLSDMFSVLSDIVEPLRDGCCEEGLLDFYNQLMVLYAQYKTLLDDLS